MLRGLSAFPITPVNAKGVLECEMLAYLTERLITANVQSVGLLGSTGTYMYLNKEVRNQAIEVAQAQNNGRVPFVVGISAMRTDDAVNYAKTARALGVSAGLLSAVSYTPLTDDEVFEHFTAVATQSGLPICIYDNPSTTHFKFSPELVARLAQVPGIIGIKNPPQTNADLQNHLQEQRVAVTAEFAIGYSGDWVCADALIAGANTWYSVLGGSFPQICVAITKAAQSGDIADAKALNEQLEPIWTIFKKYSSLRVTYEMLNHFEVVDVELPKPLLALKAEDREAVIRVLQTYPDGFFQ
ncbi:4-hydroxy-tetrahydrodipicolinate synthase [Paenochrobactrum gallinarii]|uniref:4-hydroxy-tetrahydrodipicolinate synthase n=1 Tax=Paenochrobactrum gallinarii TaxID=643673 RepID=A0A841LPQ5_9HYPH|nr:dihydrodipicolinate synthase family protein [Paenochrobactrum gallinarii]MBB6260035.1 4-hydroxy-tetrahydrodipicolinate synthase [Paenochrobactrum gallinarii]